MSSWKKHSSPLLAGSSIIGWISTRWAGNPITYHSNTLEHFGSKIIFIREKKNTYVPSLYKESAELKIEEVSVSRSDVLYLKQVREEERLDGRTQWTKAF